MRALAAAVLLALAAPPVASTPIAIGVGRGPCCIVAAGGSIWVGNHRDSSVQEIAPSSNRVVATVQAGPRSDDLSVSQLLDMAAAYGAVWVTNGGTQRLYRIDPRTRAVRSAKFAAQVGGVAAAGGKLWLTVGHTVLYRVDPKRLAPERHVDLIEHLGGLITSIAAGGGSVWIATDGGDVLQVDSSTLRIRAQLHVGRTLATTVGALAGGFYWVVQEGMPTLIRIRPSTGKIAARLPITIGRAPGFPGLAAAADGSLWLLPDPAHAVQLDRSTGRVRRSLVVPLVDSDPRNYYPASVAVGFGSTWVASWPGTRQGFADPEPGVVYRFAR